MTATARPRRVMKDPFITPAVTKDSFVALSVTKDPFITRQPSAAGEVG